MAGTPAGEESGQFWQSRRGGSKVSLSEVVTEFGGYQEPQEHHASI